MAWTPNSGKPCCDAKSPLMNILVAIRTGNSYPGKLQTLMAGNTVNRLMGASEGKAGFGMIKFQRIIDFFPTLGRMAFLAIPLQFTVGIGYTGQCY